MQKINFDLYKALPDLTAKKEESALPSVVKSKEKLNTSPVLSHILNQVRTEISNQKSQD